jgi:putative flavoprotein involved in K+ transport
MASADCDVAIVGAGQAGLATSWYLKQAGVEHVVLEAGRVAETWRSRRWDSFCLVTPNWSVKLPGGGYAGADPDGYMQRDELVEHFERWAASFDPPVREQCAVTALDREDSGFSLETSAGKVKARSVVVASGGYQRPHFPAGSREFPSSVTQVLAENYRNPNELPDGAVLIIGSGQTGCQLAEELQDSGRKVILACGHCAWAPRRFGGHDVVWWVIESGFWNRGLADLPSPAARLLGNILATGHGGGHDMHYRTLHARGVELVGRFLGAADGKVHFDPDLDAVVAAADTLAATFNKWVVALCEKRGLEIGGAPRPVAGGGRPRAGRRRHGDLDDRLPAGL